jgi:hypothetical protein
VRWRRPIYRIIFAILGGVIGGLVGSVISPPFDVILIPIGAFAGYKLVPRGRHARG